ncbi:hypothetical protein ACH5RR_005069 [Cinchona calisaya]|uniref:PAP/OAS1 substrate-binding domain superfamily n=1 Tax=Cinchona calisaya TaxID=153742 RepID=A0ABD3AZR8_9GENT
MGDFRESPIGGGASSSSSPGGGGGEDEWPVPSSSTSIISLSSNPSPSSIEQRRWIRAEKATQKIISKVQPTAVSERRRREVIDYVQKLIRNCLGCEVFPYGSVPLKTYLPDGDIDLTAFGGTNSEDILVDDMVSVLEGEDKNKFAEFAVKDIQLIRAEVKVVKCIVQNIVVDISFNQIGGLCTLCFLEQVDSLIGKEHLFKRSIILIKAWCYYESRILGAHHGLISTYALETLVLYIFHLFHSTLNGPLAVLYKFLDYFSKFDWENYCISLAGPVRLSSLPDIVVEAPEKCGSDLLLSSDFLRYCTDMFSVPSRGADLSSRVFQPKHLNIVDPLKENNNLGRSVSKGNFYRIRSAFTYGARKLGRILLQPEDDMADGLCNFFFNTLDRHGSGQRPDIQGPHPINGYNSYSNALSSSQNHSFAVESVIVKPTSDMNGSCHDGINDLKASGLDTTCGGENEEEEGTTEVFSSGICDHLAMGSALDHRILGDAKDLATYRVEGLKFSNNLPKYSELIGSKSVSPVGTPYHAPHLYFSNSMLSKGEKRNGSSDGIKTENCSNKAYPGVSHAADGTINGCYLEENLNVGVDEDPVSVGLMDVHLELKEALNPENLHHIPRDLTSESAKNPEPFSTLSDLNGDFDSHLNSLQCGRWCYEYALNTPALTMPPPPTSVFQRKNSWDAVWHSSQQFKQNGFSHKSANGVIPNPAFYTVNPLLIPGMAFGLEDVPKPRGTGTYFPNMNRLPQGYRPSAGKGRNQALPRSPRNNSRNPMFMENNMADQSSRDLSQTPVSVDQNGAKVGPSNIHQSFSPRGKGHRIVSGLVMQPEGGFEIGSVGHVPVEAHQLERGRHQQRRYLSSPENSSPVSPTREMQRLKPVLSGEHDRVSVESSYHLKDEDDFPPLSV